MFSILFYYFLIINYESFLTLKTRCTNNEEDNTLECRYKFGSWTYSGFEINLDYYQDWKEIDIMEYVPSNEYEIIERKANKHVKYYSCCPDPYVDIEYTLKLKRV